MLLWEKMAFPLGFFSARGPIRRIACDIMTWLLGKKKRINQWLPLIRGTGYLATRPGKGGYIKCGLNVFFLGFSNLKCGLNDPMAFFVAKKGVTSINKEQHPSVKVSARLMNLHRFAGKQLQGIVVQLSRWWFQIFFMFTPTWGRFSF